ncbi:hypothetical protein apy_09090 [Aeropyrum pernix]|uniref:L-fucose isomerase C-terminal domain-containing protein n=1 Tax=Aeropyrum pernix TaxID=56636 RepID=A0A401H9W0_AERPX|nr:L-fucose/L-arabinose isomerase family protein [Aeropyrum pernix]GBF09184.1 hypothetical protein apy_09090 [Aeropyrum pernix]
MPSPYDPRLDGLCVRIAASPLHSPILIARISMLLEGGFKTLWGSSPEVAPYAVTSGEELELRGCKSLLLVLATGGTEAVALEAVEKAKEEDVPVLLAAQPYANSLPSLLEVKPLLKGPGVSWIYLGSLDPRSAEALRTLEQGVRGLWAASRVRGSRIAAIGPPSPWLVSSRARHEDLARLGVELVEVDPIEFARYVAEESVPESLGEEVLRRGEVLDLADGEPKKSLRVYQAVKRMWKSRGLDAVSPACWWFYKEAGANACLAHSLLNDEGLVVGCEGDIPATLSMMLATYASGKPAFFANPAHVSRDSLLLAHCTAPFSMGLRIQFRRHFITGGSVTSSVWFPEGSKVTVSRLDPGLEVLRVGVGIIEKGRPEAEMQCESQMLVRMPGAARILEESIGNHYVATLGDSSEALRVAADILGLRLEVISP